MELKKAVGGVDSVMDRLKCGSESLPPGAYTLYDLHPEREQDLPVWWDFTLVIKLLLS